MSEISFQVSVSVDEDTGRVRATYFRFRKGAVAETVEVVEGKAFADHDSSGRLLGVEMLSPCYASLMERLGDEVAKAFIQRAIPHELAAC